jgi:hypothetical protein
MDQISAIKLNANFLISTLKMNAILAVLTPEQRVAYRDELNKSRSTFIEAISSLTDEQLLRELVDSFDK